MSKSVSRQADGLRLSTRARRRALLATTAMVAAGFGLAMAPQAALAQATINGQHVVVDPDGPGAGDPPATSGSPWDIDGELFVFGVDNSASLTVRNGAVVTSDRGRVGAYNGPSGLVTVTGD